eukprot:751347-Hanusia_phi.AAC.2
MMNACKSFLRDEKRNLRPSRREYHNDHGSKSSLTSFQVDPGIDPKGKAKGAFDARLKWVEVQGGIKKLRECKAELDSARRVYCTIIVLASTLILTDLQGEYFLPSDLVHFESISPLVKKRMLEMYVKKIRQRYNHEWNEYRKKLSGWIELQKTQDSIKSVSRDLVSSLGRSGSEANSIPQLVQQVTVMPVPHIKFGVDVFSNCEANSTIPEHRASTSSYGADHPEGACLPACLPACLMPDPLRCLALSRCSATDLNSL